MSAKRKIKKATQTQAQSTQPVVRRAIRKKNQASDKIQKLNFVLNRFEKEVETLLKKLVKQSEKSRREFKKNFEEVVGKVRVLKLVEKASATREELEREIRRIAEDVLSTFREVENLVSGEQLQDLFQNARKGIASIVEPLIASGVLSQAKQGVANTGKGLLSLLSIPSQGDMDKLEKKIGLLEKRLSSLTRKAA